MLKEGNLSTSSKRIVEISQKWSWCMQSIHDEALPSGSSAYPSKRNVILYDQKGKKIKIIMILLIRVYSMGC